MAVFLTNEFFTIEHLVNYLSLIYPAILGTNMGSSHIIRQPSKTNDIPLHQLHDNVSPG